ncbi:MAG: RNA polymerase sigma factor [Candidatus Paceibacterota bacterium]
MEELSDKELINFYLKKGEQKALEVLIGRYLKPTYNFILRFTRSPADSEDLTIETFLKMWKNLKKFNPSKDFRVWLFTIAKNTTFDFFKKRKKEYSFSDYYFFDENFEEKIPSDFSLEEKINNDYQYQLLEKEIKKLPLNYQMVLALYYNDHLSFKEISEVFQKPLNTIKSWHHRALKILKKKFQN